MATVQSGGNAKAKNAAALAAVLAAKNKGAKAEAGTALVVPKISAKAMSKDVGPRVVFGLAKVEQDETQATQLEQAAQRVKGGLMAELTTSIVKAAKNDSGIADALLATAMPDGPDKVKAMGALNLALGLALGVREVIEVPGKGDAVSHKPVWAKAVQDVMPIAGVSKDSPEGKARDGNRANWTTALRDASRVALDIIERKHEAVIDKVAGVLRLSGPEIKKQFGEQSVLLDQKKTITKPGKKGEDDVKVELKEKPSYTAIAAKAMERHGKVIHRGTNTRGGQLSIRDPLAAFESLCETLVKAIESIKGKPVERQITAMESVHSAIDKLL